ncbi:hypothetical protein BLN97_24185 [Bradyrhizobium elkanii]|nr:hypothetical protein BLN97_24185 [Bradyrhizobium elkanii]
MQSPQTAASFMSAMPMQRMAVVTGKSLFPEVRGPLMLLRRQRTKPRSGAPRRQAGTAGQITVDPNSICALPTKPLSVRPRETI